MKKIILVLAVLFTMPYVTYAQEGKITGSVEFIYVSQWVSKGVPIYGKQGGLFEAVNLNLWDSGFGTFVIHRSSTGAGNTNKERFDYGLYYKGKAFEGQSFLTKYKIRWRYEHYPNIARDKFKTTQEWAFSFSWPKLLDNGLVPRYVAYYEYPAGSGYANRNETGWLHLFGLSYPLYIQDLLAEGKKQKFGLGASISYRDGLGDTDHDWSHATFGISTRLNISDDVSLIPGIFYQISMDDSVAKRDILYSGLTFRYAF